MVSTCPSQATTPFDRGGAVCKRLVPVMSGDWRRSGGAFAKACCHGAMVGLVSLPSPISEQCGTPSGRGHRVGKVSSCLFAHAWPAQAGLTKVTAFIPLPAGKVTPSLRWEMQQPLSSLQSFKVYSDLCNLFFISLMKNKAMIPAYSSAPLLKRASHG